MQIKIDGIKLFVSAWTTYKSSLMYSSDFLFKAPSVLCGTSVKGDCLSKRNWISYDTIICRPLFVLASFQGAQRLFVQWGVLASVYTNMHTEYFHFKDRQQTDILNAYKLPKESKYVNVIWKNWKLFGQGTWQSSLILYDRWCGYQIYCYFFTLKRLWSNWVSWYRLLW